MLIPPVTFIDFFSPLNNHTHLVAILFYIIPFKHFFLSKFKHLILNVISVQVKNILCNKPGIIHTVNITTEGFFQVCTVKLCHYSTLLKNDRFSEGQS